MNVVTVLFPRYIIDAIWAQNIDNLFLWIYIYISHRMSSCVFSDRIIILDENKVQMIDTHENLIKQKNSRHYELFNSQAMYYQANTDS